jgi:peptide deformylase
VGLAAPQVGVSKRLFIVCPDDDPIVVINPKITKKSPKMATDWEGCLSIPGLRGQVPRHTSVEVEFTGLDGKAFRMEAKGFLARIFQHENDHLDGIFFIDRVKTTRDLISESEYQKMHEDDDD